jgi:hypothetical protein
MANRPRFSVVLPTIGRTGYLTDAIESICWQTFPDFELIVSDNSNDGRVKAITDEYLHDERLRYVRPHTQLNMPDHWEFASLQATGDFVFILQDRFVMLPNALRVIDREISRFSEPSLTYWPHAASYDHRTGRVANVDSNAGTSELKNPRELIHAFARFEVPRNYMPHASNSFYRRDLASTIRRHHERLFRPLAPDDAAGFLQLAYADTLLFVDQQFWIGRPTSIGTSTGHNAQLVGTRDYACSVGVPDFLRNVPLPIDTVVNCIIYDLLAIKQVVHPRLSGLELNLEKYSLAIYREIVDKDASASKLDTAAMYRQWYEFINQLPPEIRHGIQKEIPRLSIDVHSNIGRLKRMVRRLGFQPYFSAVKAKLRWGIMRIRGHVGYKTILEAAVAIDNRQLLRKASATHLNAS